MTREALTAETVEERMAQLVDSLPETPRCVCGHVVTLHHPECGRCPAIGPEDGPSCGEFTQQS